jgi:hypothetical protein
VVQEGHWLPGFNFNVEEWHEREESCETLAICGTVALARAAFEATRTLMSQTFCETAARSGLPSGKKFQLRLQMLAPHRSRSDTERAYRRVPPHAPRNDAPSA